MHRNVNKRGVPHASVLRVGGLILTMAIDPLSGQKLGTTKSKGRWHSLLVSVEFSGAALFTFFVKGAGFLPRSGGPEPDFFFPLPRRREYATVVMHRTVNKR